MRKTQDRAAAGRPRFAAMRLAACGIVVASALAGCVVAPTGPAVEPVGAPDGAVTSVRGAPSGDRAAPGAAVGPNGSAPAERDAGLVGLDGGRSVTAAAGVAEELVVRALGQIGVGYRFGGADPVGGFDCSGLVHYVYREAAGIALPRRAEQMSRVGRAINPEKLVPGDLVFYNTLHRPYSHVAIYIGDGRFVHAPARGGQVRIESLGDGYWRARFDGARRLIDAQPGDDAPLDSR